MNPKAVIIGSGIGGLCTGIRLLKTGYDVEIFEKLGVAGGVTNEYVCQNQKFRFDNTASIVIDPQEYDQIFLDAELNPRDYFEFVDLDILYQVFFESGKQHKLYYDMEKQRKEFELSFQESFDHYTNFVKDYTQKYATADRGFLTQDFSRLRDIAQYKILKQAVKLKPFCTVNTGISEYIQNEEFRDFLLFQCLYMGFSPYKMVSTYATVPAVSQHKGIRHIKGGMTAYTNGLLKAFLNLGGVIHYHSPVKEIEIVKNAACGIRTKQESMNADIVVSDADYCETVSRLIHRTFFPRAMIRKDPDLFLMSCSVFILRLALCCKYDNLSVHNVYINQNFKAEIERIFAGILPENPSIYIYYPAAADNSFGDETYSCMNVMVRVPNLSFQANQWNTLTIQSLRNKCLEILSKITGDNEFEKRILFQDYMTPCHLKDLYHCHDGAAFGIGHSLTQSMMFRPQATSPKIKNLYFVGSSIHPGNGVTMVMKSAKIAVDLISEKDNV